MNIYSAIMAAATAIEERPDRFDFGSVNFPSCGGPGCALGWIGHFLGFKEQRGSNLSQVCERLGTHFSTHSNCEFYKRLDALETPGLKYKDSWRKSASGCAKVLRLYAEKYHSHEKTVALDPAFVKFKGDLNELIVSESLSHRPQ